MKDSHLIKRRPNRMISKETSLLLSLLFTSEVVGVAFHVGSGCRSSDSHAVGLQRARALFEHEARAGRRGRMRIVDIGGGFLSAATGCIDEKMDGLAPNSVKRHHLSALVLDDKTPDFVARTMIMTGKQKEPFHIFDMDEAHRRIQHFKMMLPRVKICYAMKSNDYVMMLKLAIAEGAGFDCASPGEIKKILQLGANPRSIVYAVTMKTPDQMIFAREAGVKHTTFDTVYELEKLKMYWPDASLLLRIRVESNSIYKLGDKFGCEFEEAFDLLDKAAHLGLRVAGVAFHVGSACFSPESYELGLRRARALFDHEARAGRRMALVDIGGGFLSDRTERIDEIADIINCNLKELFPDPKVQITAEPGRYLCDSSTTLYCNILNVRTVQRNDQILNLVYMMDGVYGTLRFSEPWHTVEKFKWSSDEVDDEPKQEVILYGPSGDSTDIVMKDYKVMLPPCSPHDWLIFRIQGAYTSNFATNFSCLPIPLIRPVVSLQLWKTLESHSVFKPTDFILNPDFPAALPSTMPPVASTRLLPRLSRESLFLQC